MRTVLIKAEIIEVYEDALRLRLDEGFGTACVIVHESKAIPVERLDNPDAKKAAHTRQQRKRA